MRCILNIIPYFKTNVNRFTKKNKKIFLTRLLTKQELYDILYYIYYIIYLLYYILLYLFINILIRTCTCACVRTSKLMLATMYARSACKHPVEQVTCEALAELVIAFKTIIRGLEGPNGRLPRVG